MNLVIGRESIPPKLHMMLDNERLCLRQDPLPAEFVHFPWTPQGGAPLCPECTNRLATIKTNNQQYKGA
jgi:hypothetical protein